MAAISENPYNSLFFVKKKKEKKKYTPHINFADFSHLGDNLSSKMRRREVIGCCGGINITTKFIRFLKLLKKMNEILKLDV